MRTPEPRRHQPVFTERMKNQASTSPAAGGQMLRLPLSSPSLWCSESIQKFPIKAFSKVSLPNEAAILPPAGFQPNNLK